MYFQELDAYIRKIGGQTSERNSIELKDSIDITLLEYIPRVDLIKELRISTPKMKNHLAYFKNLNLQNLHVHEVDLSLEDVQTIGDFLELESLYINTCHFPEDVQTLGDFTELESLYINACNFPEDFVKELKDFKKLKNIAIEGSNLTDENILEICENPNLDCVSLGENNITEKGLEGLSSLKQLSRLSIKDCGMQIENLFDILVQCPQLRYLNISGNVFTENAHQKIKQLAILEDFNQLVMSRKDVPLRELRDIKNALPNVGSFDF
ncbi:MAG: hypothetical protein HRT89_10130 [Lentisphaeria bacterium]|nr:hypothetical protein [Lentisphaeria bacterium]NQZ68418.1 hypothetical protein [Lentisphaeria bacterium]